jgi:broad specificity phosphatase PhoE
LTEDGRAQALEAARALSKIPIDAVYSSSLDRAKDTASAIAESRGLAVVTDPRLNEMNYGEWEGRTHEEIREENPGQWETWAEDPAAHRAGVTGETAVEVFDRMNSFMEEVLVEGRTILVVGHHSSNRIYVAGSLGMPLSNYRRLSIDNLGACVLEWSDWGRIWRQINGRLNCL